VLQELVQSVITLVRLLPHSFIGCLILKWHQLGQTSAGVTVRLTSLKCVCSFSHSFDDAGRQQQEKKSIFEIESAVDALF
jgi:hypothetical protein